MAALEAVWSGNCEQVADKIERVHFKTVQIKEKNYCKALEEFSGKVLLVGINYDKATKIHECVIEECEFR